MTIILNNTLTAHLGTEAIHEWDDKRVQTILDIVVHRIVWKKGGAIDKVDCIETIGGGIFSWKGCTKIKT